MEIVARKRDNFARIKKSLRATKRLYTFDKNIITKLLINSFIETISSLKNYHILPQYVFNGNKSRLPDKLHFHKIMK